MMAMKTDMTGAAIVIGRDFHREPLGARSQDHSDRTDDREPAE